MRTWIGIVKLIGPTTMNFRAFHTDSSTTKCSHPGTPLLMRFVQMLAARQSNSPELPQKFGAYLSG
ncbi:hypothetical protein [Agreia bicolorata]|uniref:hypothetical protein n=1 Tax=Agreia bicolorata TaxID=110935 RepID=UPI00126A3940|nr:hypothetical protein [Agreia bicolorata]